MSTNCKRQLDDFSSSNFKRARYEAPDAPMQRDERFGPGSFHLLAGLKMSDGNNYTALKDATALYTPYMLAGVVKSITPARKTKNDWVCCVELVDPSLETGYKINSFMKKKESLPQAKEGDVLIMRGVKRNHAKTFLPAVGYSDSLKWAAYTPSTRSVNHGDVSHSTQNVGLIPFYYSPNQEELVYCQDLVEWKKALDATNSTAAVVPVPARILRRHRLISEAGPRVAPDGYFDCTVEVLETRQIPGKRFFSIYVTDYTHNDGLAEYCLGGLRGQRVLHVEMWDAARTVGLEIMSVGSFWTLKNVRMIISRGAYVEAKLVETDVTQLTEGAEEYNESYKNLLERKKNWEDRNSF